MLTAEQQVERRKGIGGSEIAAVAGLSPYAGPLEVFLSKMGEAPEVDGFNVERGTYLGPALARWYAKRTGRAVTHLGRQEKTLRHPAHEIVVATPDGQVHESTKASKVIAPLEAKAPHWMTAQQWGPPGTDEIPDHHVPQTQWEAAVLDADSAEVAALISGDLQIYTVPFDPELFAALVDVAERFWRDHIVTGKAPDVDGSESARRWLEKQHPRAARDLIEATEDAEAHARAYIEASDAAKEAETAKNYHGNRLRQLIGDHDGIDGVVTWRNNKASKRIDWEAVAREAGANDDLIAQHTITKPGPRVLRVKKL